MLVGTKRFVKGGTSIKERDIGGWKAYVGLGIIRVIRQGDDRIRPSYAIKKEGGGKGYLRNQKKGGEGCVGRNKKV